MQTRERMNQALPVLVGMALILGFLAWAQPVVVPVALATCSPPVAPLSKGWSAAASAGGVLGKVTGLPWHGSGVSTG